MRLTREGECGLGGGGGGGGRRPPAWQQPLGDARGSPRTPDVQAFPTLGSHSSTKAGQCGRPVSDNEGDMAGDGIARLPVSTPEMDCPTRKMWPAVAGGTTTPQPVVDLSDVRESAVGRPLSVGAPEFSPRMDPRTQQTSASVTRSNAAGTVAPVDFAGLSVPVVFGIQFLAVAEVHSSAMDLVDDTLVVCAHE